MTVRTCVVVIGLAAAGLLASGCRRKTNPETTGNSAPSASASAALAPLDWSFENKNEVLFRGLTSKRRRALVGVLPKKNQALVTREAECYGEPPRCGPSHYQVVDYKEGRVVEEADLETFETHCERTPPADIAAALRWSKLVASFGVPAAEATPSAAYWPMPDGKHLVYVSCGKEKHVTLSDADGKNPRIIDTPDQHDYLWAASSAELTRGRTSPDGRTFVWSNGGLLAVLDIASGAVQTLGDAGTHVGAFDWSPDGARLHVELVKPSFRTPKEVCIATVEGKDTLTAKSVACRGDLERAGGMLVAPDGKSALLLAADAQLHHIGWWIGLPGGAAKGSLPPGDLSPLGLSPGLPIVDGIEYSSTGGVQSQWLATRDLETGRAATLKWSKDLSCFGGGSERPRWLDARRVMILCQGVSNERGISAEYQLIAVDLATAVGR